MTCMRHFSCPRVAANQIHPILMPNSSHHFPRFFCLQTTTMSDGLKSQSSSSSSTLLTTAAKKQEAVEPSPPPPEKPLPGDCCGSGCVRCVWDIYYEELEEYNDLYKNKPPSVSSSSDINSNKRS